MNTPNKRYSCTSEYATPKGVDDSDNSLYYSFVLSEDDGVSKENSINGGQWAVSDLSNSPMPSRASKTKTPLLRKVLQANNTPRNKNNKRVSFNFQPKPSPTPSEISRKISKMQPKSETIPTGGVNPSSTFDMKLIEANLAQISQEKPKDDGTVAENGENGTVSNDSASDVTDDLENDDTIIENPSSTWNILVENHTEMPENTEKPDDESPTTERTSDLPQTSKSEEMCVPTTVQTIPSLPTHTNSNNTKTVEDILRGAVKNGPKVDTRNSARVTRQRLTIETRKSILPARATTYKRRSSTYEPRKINPRKSLSVLKHVVNKVTKSMTDTSKPPVKSAGSAPNSKPKTGTVGAKSVLPTSRPIAKPANSTAKPTTSKVETSRVPIKPRLTLASQPPRVPIMSTRSSISASVRAQRRDTKYSFTALAVSKASSANALEPASSGKVNFVKPSGLPVRKSVIPANTPASTSGSKCQFCDKYFAKNHGMTTHLLEKCEKIPASVRRTLLQKKDNSDEIKSKQVSRHRTHAFGQDIDSISKYSRFFVNVSNGGASGMPSDDVTGIDVENGLKNLRAELRKIKSVHTGIIRTPSKPLRCHICKKIFFDCVEYAEHSSSGHSKISI